MADVRTGWERDNRAHFDEIVAGYDRIRPNYPDKLFADVLNYTGACSGKKALEIGAGTGKATAPFLGAGFDVTAVEIGANMTELLRERFEGRKLSVITAAFEDALFEENSYDLIYAASAFHWVNAEVGCPKAYRLLKPNGAIALMRYNFNIVPADGEELCEELRAIYEKYYYSYFTSKKRSVKITHELLKSPTKILNGYGFEDLQAYGFKNVTMKLYDVILTYSADEYIALEDTMADHRALPEENRTALYAGIRDAIQQNGGYHSVNCVFQLYMGRV